MKFSKLITAILSLVVMSIGCKTDGKTHTKIAEEGNNLEALSSLGVIDFSKAVLARQDAAWPESVAQSILFKSESLLNSYCEISPK
jgi:hypothetical protein